jgi:RNA polymerase sigma-70 factor, ECF subfamily
MNNSLESAGSSTSRSLIRRAQARDPEAWQRLVDLYGPLVFYWCQRSGLSSPDAADVFQETFAAVSAALDRFRHGEENQTFRGWLWTIARNKIRDHFRRNTAEPSAVGGSKAQQRLAEIPDEWSDVSDDPRDRAEIQKLYRRGLDLVRAEFEDRTWQAFWRVVVEGHDTADVAADLGLSRDAVRQYKSRVLRRLRQELGDLPG